MKKWIALLLVFVLALSLCACGEKIDEQTQAKLDLYDEYEDYIELLEEEKYEKLMEKIYKLWEKQQNNQDQDDPDDDPTDPPPTDPPVTPTEEEQAALDKYYRIAYALYHYEQNGYLSLDVYDEEGNWISFDSDREELQYCYEQLIQLEQVDKWVGTEYLPNYWGTEVNWNRLELIGNFVKVEDVALTQKHTTTDHMGNVNEGWSYPVWYYDQSGALTMLTNPTNVIEQIESNPMDFGSTHYYYYGDDGRVSDIKCGYMDGDTMKVYTIITPTYDAAGNVISQHIKTNEGECDITYTYDANGRLVEINCPTYVESNSMYTYTYTYDAAGNLVKEEKVQHYYYEYYDAEIVNYKYITEYTYDASGNLISGVYTDQYWNYSSDSDYNDTTGEWEYTVTQYVYHEKQDQYTYTCDDQGRVVSQQITYGDTYYMAGDNAGQVYDEPSYASEVIDFVYGDYYFYGAE